MTSAASKPGAPRLHVLVSAYACGPGAGPEAGAGWAFATAAAVHHDVVVVTRTRFRDAIEQRRASDTELAAHLTVEYLDLPPRVMALKRRGVDLYWYYAAWQHLLAQRARALHARHPFDVVHHVTFANDWMPCGAAEVRGPGFVWGPVGGASRVPLRTVGRWLGVRGYVTELVRVVATGLPRRIWGDRAARRAALVVAQNDDVAQRFREFGPVVVEPNAALTELPARAQTRQGHVVVFTARLLAWKGGRLAVAALAQPPLADWRLDVYGTGYEEAAMRRMARRLGVEGRVRFLGERPRAEVLDAFAHADALLFPSMHDQAGWVAAEASAIGCPVVCLPLGGPPLLAARNARVVPVEGDLVANLALEVSRAARLPGVAHHTWDAGRLPDLLQRWYDDVARNGSVARHRDGDGGPRPARSDVASDVPPVGQQLAEDDRHG